MARVKEPAIRLLETAIRLLSEAGPESLQARRLAAESGMSTMAVYTHFGGMPQLIRAIAREGFIRLGRRLESSPHGDDPVADLLDLGLAYRDHAVENPQLYRLMFGVTATAGNRLADDLPEGEAAFAHLVKAVTRIIESGRAREEDPARAAAQIWSAIHGYVLLEIAGYFGGDGVEQILLPLGMKLATGAGDTAEAAARSAAEVTAHRTRRP
ncbi:TetR/AcrR family transcriptional regulator [Actinomadura sp. DC4]|uniref:TetR/AcrR family transcriptional regulator n=1 Tax=Actinomadura sp. DC4 TaxID=3055069 RepID=UPI0025B2746A|nr:TetR/AcrR family transcriptional regulator [Actinomadura sp. DC4]MDN3356715.1 TetR/AcrR family transcriptional regulator [Actinomadura sp. DC4]